ncbi:ribulose-bisphosphate carboxylase large subunit family protein [Pullulanibacillus sp. KACC 23026]|uniref:ribulose-bisphosphate carboxylase large subunit family protein n=1 Tax=Pullulanibacillus sp. KACC 23026 TaxID=3028315 RepID=UPI0023B0FB47|nr:ribulose-bisphosphate carboxylase large subunit family protein [Pullulanibacillus sp. KACC 23026]WEG11744.1 ribulose-bisphosphate carboxylase large subunit family protein [Pullulanibacillus sp. KACC 23026]
MVSQLAATYLVETPYSLDYAAEKIAGEQSTGTFTSVPGESQDLVKTHGARIINIKQLEPVKQPSLPGGKTPQKHDGLYRRGEITVSFPLHNFGPSIPNLLATVAGNLFELQELTGIRLLDLNLPDEFMNVYQGPKFGIEGTRSILNVYDRPIIGTIVKPSVGLSMDELKKLVFDLAVAGLDFIKDDELNANPPYAPLKVKVPAVMEAIEAAADQTGRKIMYAFNITGDIDELKQNHDLVVKSGGTCVMVSINSVGLAGLAHLNKFSEVPIHGHRNQWGMYTRSPFLGMDFTAYQKLCRLAGADHLHVNGLNGKFYESNKSVINSIKSCLEPLLGGNQTMPVISNGQWAGTVQETFNNIKTNDVMHLAGGGILGHPDGPSAGFESMKLAWEAAKHGVDFHEFANDHPSLKRAIHKFGRN